MLEAHEIDDIAEVVAGAVREATAPLLKRIEQLEQVQPPAPEKGEDGKDCDMAAVDAMLTEKVAAAVAAIPLPENGEDGVGLAGGLIDNEGRLVLTLTDGTTKTLSRVEGKDGEDGKPGEPGLGFDDLNVEQIGERTLRFLLKRGEDQAEFDIKFPVPIYRDVWKSDGEYEPGDMTTWAGSLWHCDEPKGLKPGDPDSGWRMVAKKGRDGKDAPKKEN